MGFIDLDKIIDVDDITDLEQLGYLQIDLDDIFGEISEIANHLSQLPSYKLRDLFCDMVGVNHHTPKDELMKLLSGLIS